VTGGRRLARVVAAGGASPLRLGLAALLGAGAVGAAVALMAVSGYLISRAAQRPETILVLTVAIVGVRLFALARAGLRYGERLATHDVAFRALATLRARFFARLAPLVPGATGMHAGDLLSRFTGDVDRLQDLYVRALAPPAVALLAGAGAVLAAWLIVPAAGAVLLLGLLLGGLGAPWLVARTARRAAGAQAPARAALTSELIEALDGAAELAVAGRARERVARIERLDARLSALARRDAWTGGLAAGSSSLLAGLTLCAVLAVGVRSTASGALDAVLLASLAFVAMAAFDAVAPLPAAAQHLAACADAAARLEDVTGREPPVRDPAEPLPAPPRAVLAADHVGDRVLRDVTLRLEPGRAIALVGPSGAGKSTLAELLVRFRDPARGRITLGGVDVRRLRQDDLRRTVALVDQDAHLFATSIRENLLLARRSAGDGELRRALRDVGLGPWLAAQPDGLDTQVGEHGARVSGGERRRLAVARALLCDAPLVIVDEPAAHLDEPAAAALQRTLLAAARTRGRGLLLITHSAGGLDAYDELHELQCGFLRTERRHFLAHEPVSLADGEGRRRREHAHRPSQTRSKEES
jgi:thiol reductant ABC exporter CydC subunit